MAAPFAAVLALGIGSSCGQSSSPGAVVPPPGGDASPAGDGSAPAPADVLQHHKNPSRDGVYVDPGFSAQAAAGLHADATFAGKLTGAVYAQPLWVSSGPGGQEAFLVATEENHVTAIDATGAVLWDKTFGSPVGGGLPCGNITPLGITGTPIVDTVARTIYFDAMTDGTSGPDHLVYAITLDDGSVESGWPVDMNAKVTGFDSSHQNQRGALALVNGTLYVPFGGLDGDCDPYHGWVVAIATGNPGAVSWYKTAASRGGIWASGSLPSDGTYVYPVTGNTEGTGGTWGGGEAVLRLGAGASFSGATNDYYTPSNWESLDNADADLGGANDFLLDMPGAPVPHLVVAAGKDQNLYLLDRDKLGGVGAELSKTHIATGDFNGAGAAYHTSQGTYAALHVSGASGVSCPGGRGGNLVVVKISAASPPVPSIAWCSVESGLGSPMVTSTDGATNAIVWDAGKHLYGYDGDTGMEIYTGGASTDAMSSGLQAFNSAIETRSRIAVAVSGRLYLFH